MDVIFEVPHFVVYVLMGMLNLHILEHRRLKDFRVRCLYLIAQASDERSSDDWCHHMQLDFLLFICLYFIRKVYFFV